MIALGKPKLLEARMIKRSLVSLVTTAIMSSFVFAASANASLLTGVTFDRELSSVSDRATKPVTTTSSQFAGTSLPASDTLNLVSASGGVYSATYEFTDNGSTADFRINTSYSMPGSDGFTEESPSSNTIPIQFTTDQALDYAIQVTNSAEATGGSAGVSVGDILNGSTSVFNFSEQVPPYVVHGTSPTASISLHTGVLLPGTYDLIEEVSAGGDIPANGEPPSLITGTSSFDFVLTPVNPAGTPEPSSIAMMSTAFVSCLLAARRKRMCGGISLAGSLQKAVSIVTV